MYDPGECHDTCPGDCLGCKAPIEKQELEEGWYWFKETPDHEWWPAYLLPQHDEIRLLEDAEQTVLKISTCTSAQFSVMKTPDGDTI